MHFNSAYLLVSHGSRDPRSQIAVEHLAQLVAQQLHKLRSQGRAVQPEQVPLVATAVLEFGSMPLHQQIQQFGLRALQAGYETVSILPVFLLTGVHVMEDLPQQIELAQQQLGNQLQIVLRPHLGSHPDLWQLLLNPIDEITPQTGKVLLSHGSRRSGSQQSIESIAARLDAVVAYWSTAPSLEEQVSQLIQHGYQQITILPYFLFEGGLTDAIAQQVDHLRQQFPYAQLHITRPIGATVELAQRAVDLLL